MSSARFIVSFLVQPPSLPGVFSSLLFIRLAINEQGERGLFSSIFSSDSPSHIKSTLIEASRTGRGSLRPLPGRRYNPAILFQPHRDDRQPFIFRPGARKPGPIAIPSASPNRGIPTDPGYHCSSFPPYSRVATTVSHSLKLVGCR